MLFITKLVKILLVLVGFVCSPLKVVMHQKQLNITVATQIIQIGSQLIIVTVLGTNKNKATLASAIESFFIVET